MAIIGAEVLLAALLATQIGLSSLVLANSYAKQYRREISLSLSQPSMQGMS